MAVLFLLKTYDRNLYKKMSLKVITLTLSLMAISVFLALENASAGVEGQILPNSIQLKINPTIMPVLQPNTWLRPKLAVLSSQKVKLKTTLNSIGPSGLRPLFSATPLILLELSDGALSQISLNPPTNSLSSTLSGDVNGDGEVTQTDANLALNASAGKIILNPSQQTKADMNGDGKVNAADAIKILQQTTRNTGVMATAALSSPYHPPSLIDDLNNPNYLVRYEATLALGEKEDPQSVPYLVPMLNDEVATVRLAAAQALGEIGDSRAVDPLSDTLLDDEVEYVRLAAAQALGEIGDSRAVDPLILSLDTFTRPAARGTIAEALGQIGDPRAIPTLFGLMNERTEASVKAWQALRAMGVLSE